MQCSRRWRLAAKLRRRSALLRRRAVCALLRCRASMMSCCFVLCSSVDVLRALLRRRDLLFARDLVCFARSATRSSAVFFAALRAAVAHLLPSLSFPAKTNQQGHKAKEATSNEEAAAPACIWPSNGCCSPEIGAGKPSNRIFRGASRRISLPVL